MDFTIKFNSIPVNVGFTVTGFPGCCGVYIMYNLYLDSREWNDNDLYMSEKNRIALYEAMHLVASTYAMDNGATKVVVADKARPHYDFNSDSLLPSFHEFMEYFNIKPDIPSRNYNEGTYDIVGSYISESMLNEDNVKIVDNDILRLSNIDRIINDEDRMAYKQDDIDYWDSNMREEYEGLDYAY